MFLESKVRPVRGADCKPIVYATWDPEHLRTLQASTACYRDSFTCYFFFFTLHYIGNRLIDGGKLVSLTHQAMPPCSLVHGYERFEDLAACR
jgi:hypothetical protein